MPKSKRAKVVHLSKVEKKGKEHTEKLYNAVREAADEYPFIYVFRVDNMRNNYLKEVRTEFNDSRYVRLWTRANSATSLGVNTFQYPLRLSKWLTSLQLILWKDESYGQVVRHRVGN